ncbi:LuxR C-terminal-related transcriptional regulator [Paenibacillus sp. 1P03SA]|uniref:LuxR C-terminal-related transcriptional regulator n=1 Tax=Paenibacillus sp. 1P03SA TaxID=3132294 RepID=UPI0039A06D79
MTDTAPDAPVILKTKITTPFPKADLVARERLTDSLSRGIDGRLTLVCAPAGFGKTTLLTQWAHNSRHTCAWLSLDARDNDFIRFWRTLVRSLAGKSGEPTGQRLTALTLSLQDISVSTFLDELLNELYELPGKTVLVLDDYHLIGDTRIHDSLAYFIEYLPSALHVLIASRSELPFSTVKWTAKQEHNELHTATLQFTADETAAFYRDVHNQPLTDEQIRRLAARTEGWVTGLQLALLSLQSGTDAARFLDEFHGDHRVISDYLFEEVASQLPPDLYSFVLKTSVLQEMDADLCDAVTERTDARNLLELAKKSNLFLLPLDERDAWFRYHHLFAGFLQELLKRKHPEEWLRLNRLASATCISRGFMSEAVEYAIAGEDYPLLESCLKAHIPAVLESGELGNLLRWFRSFPQEYVIPPALSLHHAFVLLMTGQAERAEQLLDRVEASLESAMEQEERKELQSGLLFVRSNLMFITGIFDKWFAHIGTLLNDILPADPAFYTFNYNRTEPLVRRTPLGLKGMLSPDTERIGTMFAGLLEARGWQGSYIYLYVMQSLSEGYYEWNRLEDSRKLAVLVSRSAPAKELPGLYVPVHLTQAMLYAADGRFELAHAAVDEAFEAASGLKDSRWRQLLHGARIRLYLKEDRSADVKKALPQLGVSGKDKPGFRQEFEYVTLARALGSQRKEKEALRLLELLKPQCEREQLLSGIIEIAILQALLENQRGQRTAALHHLHEALELGAQNGYIRSFLDEGPAMESLLRAYARQYRLTRETAGQGDGLQDYVSKLLSLFMPASTRRVTPDPALAEELSRSEISLLRLIRQGATNKQMAEQLTLSEGTVKVYLSRLYEKLGVSSRTQALVTAQELKLLDAGE